MPAVRTGDNWRNESVSPTVQFDCVSSAPTAREARASLKKIEVTLTSPNPHDTPLQRPLKTAERLQNSYTVLQGHS